MARCSRCGGQLPELSRNGICPGCGEVFVNDSGEGPETASAAAAKSSSAAAVELPASPTLALTERPGDKVGHYRIVQQIGEGGCGVVYVAEQEEPLKRRVALKVIKLGMDTREVIARFEAERQALALMDHPNIAKVLDAGATQTGRPFFVMELVKGIPITRYCDERQLPVTRRIEIFLQVCQAIQHAHQKGIIHRDIKPSNILVADQDGVPAPKVIDFGIAKATAGQTLTDKTLYTALEQFLGTPAYMSPEQAELSSLDVDTRSDIYSLGVLLYELLTGKTPFDAKRLVQAGLDELRRFIREEDPPRPSTRLTKLEADEQTTVAKRRHAEPLRLLGLLRGDLDWIVMKCLEKDRTRRYESASGLANDLRRHLEDQPVEACPPSMRYRVTKYVRRHKLGVAAAAVIILAVVAGTTGTIIGLWKAVRAEKRAVAEATTAKRVSDFLVELFSVSDPSEARGNSITAREILDKGAAKLDKELADQPLVRARLMETIGTVYRSLGLLDQARAMLEASLKLKKSVSAADDLSVADSLHNLGIILDDQGKYAEAVSFFRQSLEIRTRKLGPNAPEVARSLNSLAAVYWNQENYTEAESLFLRALAIKEQTLGPDNLEVANTLINLGILKYSGQKFAEAEPYLKRGLAISEKKLGPDHPDLGTVLNNLGALYESQGRRAEAEPIYLRCLGILEKALGPDHPDVAMVQHNLANLYRNLGKYAEAEPLYARSRAVWEKSLGKEHRWVGASLREHANLYREEGKYADAEPLYRQALTVFEKNPEANRLEIIETIENYRLLLQKMNRTEEAAKLETRLKSLGKAP